MIRLTKIQMLYIKETNGMFTTEGLKKIQLALGITPEEIEKRTRNNYYGKQRRERKKKNRVLNFIKETNKETNKET